MTKNKIKNIFHYATKELSQDAFLRWLFENYDCENENVRSVFKRLFRAFTNIDPDDKKIENLETLAQWKSIDISVWFKIDGEEHLIVIEDKTTSGIHGSQLDRYSDAIKVHNDFWNKQKEKGKEFSERYIEKGKEDKNIHRVFYKTAKSEEAGWGKSFKIEEIYKLFADVYDTGSEILDSYAEHIRDIYNATNNTEKPTEHKENIDLFKWKAYFENTVIPRLSKCGYKVHAQKAGQYPYMCLIIQKEGGSEKIPYLEIRSRDCLNNNFVGRILLYDVIRNDANNAKISQLKENIRETMLVCQNNKQQIGITPENLKAKTDVEFIQKVEEFAKEYLNAMKNWT